MSCRHLAVFHEPGQNFINVTLDWQGLAMRWLNVGIGDIADSGGRDEEICEISLVWRRALPI